MLFFDLYIFTLANDILYEVAHELKNHNGSLNGE